MQNGSLERIPRQSGDYWRFKWRDGQKQRSEYVGTVAVYPTQSQAMKAAERFRRLIHHNVEVIVVSDLIEKFWKESPPERKTTAHGYRSIFQRIDAEYGDFRVDSLPGRIAEIERWLNSLQTVRGRKRPASPMYKGQVRNLFHLLVEKAMLWGHCPVERNPISLITVKHSSRRQKEIVVLTVEQYHQLLDDPNLPELVRVIIQVAACLGLRISEILGLRWSDFDFLNRSVKIQRSAAEGSTGATKTATSQQSLPLHPELIDVLREWRDHAFVVKGWVFGSARTGRPYDRDYLREEYLKPAGERIGVDGIGFHSFRHTFRALLRKNGESLETQKTLLRHSRIATTMSYGGAQQVEEIRPANAKVIEMLRRA